MEYQEEVEDLFDVMGEERQPWILVKRMHDQIAEGEGAVALKMETQVIRASSQAKIVHQGAKHEKKEVFSGKRNGQLKN